MLPGGISHLHILMGRSGHTSGQPEQGQSDQLGQLRQGGNIRAWPESQILVSFSFLNRFDIDRRQKQWCVVFMSHSFGYLASYPGALYSP